MRLQLGEPAPRRVAGGAQANLEEAAADGSTALHRMAAKNRMHGATTLLAAGAEVNRRNSASETPLHLAARAQHHDMAVLLLAFGALPHAADAAGKTPMDLDATFQWDGSDVGAEPVGEREMEGTGHLGSSLAPFPGLSGRAEGEER